MFLLVTVVLLAVSSLDLVNCQSCTDPCELTTGMGQDNPPLNIPAGCTSGKINWHYPQGYLVLNATRTWMCGTDFKLCFTDSDGPATFDQVTDLSGGGKTVLPLPAQDAPSCAQSVDGVATIRAYVNDLFYYMTFVSYTIQ